MSQADLQQQDFRLPGHIQPGDAAPWWKQGRYKFAFDRAFGRYIVLCFLGNTRDAIGQAALHAVLERSRKEDAGNVSLICVTPGPMETMDSQFTWDSAGLDFIYDNDWTVHRAYGVGSRMWIVLDPMLRVIKVIPFSVDGTHVAALNELLDTLPPPAPHRGVEGPVPVLVLSNVFEPAFCQHLIHCYEAHGGRESGFMEEINGKTVELHDPDWKRRRDFLVTDQSLIGLINERISRRVGVMVHRAFQFKFSRIERYLIGCYSAEDNGHFGAHRDDTVRGTEHRRFAVSINLNSDFDGGGLSFPEYSTNEFKVPVGTAVVFSASLLHRVSKVTRGSRYAFLPFLYDEEAERVRLANLKFLEPHRISPDQTVGG